jgi:hypothetical protein
VKLVPPAAAGQKQLDVATLVGPESALFAKMQRSNVRVLNVPSPTAAPVLPATVQWTIDSE